MGIFDALTGKKKEEVMPPAPVVESPFPPMQNEPKPFPPTDPGPMPARGPIPLGDPNSVRDHQSELILTKLDLVVQKITEIEKRLAEIERIAKEE